MAEQTQFESIFNSLFRTGRYRILMARSILLSLCIYGTTDYCIPEEMIKYSKSLYGGKYIYLTNICLYLTVLTLIVGVAVRYWKKKSLIGIYVNLISVVFPLEFLVTLLFWSLFLISPTLVRDEALYNDGVRVNLLSDMCMHFFPFIALVLEQIDVYFTRDRKHILFFSFFCVSYFTLCFIFSNLNGIWVYPILDKLLFMGRFLLFSSSNILVWCFYELFMYLSFDKKFFVISNHQSLKKPESN